jgi:hypothetical protein
MMNAQESRLASGSLPGSAKALTSGQVVTLGTTGGEVRILSGRIWLTSPGDLSDHVLGAGESFSVLGSGPTLVEAWDRGAPALITWRSRTILERARDAVTGAWGRCWDLMNPAGRVGIGSVAAMAGLVLAGLLFGPVSQARVRRLAHPAVGASVLHNAGPETRGSPADGSNTRDRASRAAQEAGRGAPGVA